MKVDKLYNQVRQTLGKQGGNNDNDFDSKVTFACIKLVRFPLAF